MDFTEEDASLIAGYQKDALDQYIKDYNIAQHEIAVSGFGEAGGDYTAPANIGLELAAATRDNSFTNAINLGITPDNIRLALEKASLTR